MPDAQGIWRCIGTYTDRVHIGDVLAHICEQYDINIHDYLQFARYNLPHLQIEVRVQALRICLTFNPV